MSSRKYRQVTVTGNRPQSDYIGLTVAVDTADSGRLIGTVERFDGQIPVVRFPDGRWAFGSRVMRVVRDS